jgi:hypothetical protein
MKFNTPYIFREFIWKYSLEKNLYENEYELQRLNENEKWSCFLSKILHLWEVWLRKIGIFKVL